MRHALTCLATGLLAIALPGVAWSADYYVDSAAGSDGAAGTSQGTAWKTVAKVNGAALVAGDTVRFKRGGVWRESLVPPASGAAGNPIIFESYGTGAKPVFYGSDVLTNASFTNVGGNVWRYNVGAGIDANYAYVLADHAFVGSGPATYNNPNIDVTLPSDPTTDGKLYTFCKRGNVVGNNGKSHLVFRDLVADETAANPDGAQQGYGMRAEGGSDILFEDCEALRCGRHNFGVINADEVTLRRCHAAWVAPAIAGDNSLYVSYADSNLTAASSTSVYEDCTAAHQDRVGGGQYDFYDGHSQNGKPLHVTFDGIATGGGKLYCDSNPGGSYTFLGGTINGGRIENWTDGITIDGTVFTGSAFIDQWKNGGTIQNCVWDNVTPGETACILFRAGVTSNTVRFNTIRSTGNCLGFYGSAAGLKLVGNIFAGVPSSGGSAGDVSVADWNCYTATPTTMMGQAWATWKGTRDTHSLVGDPLFTDAATGDYTLQASSLAIDAAGAAGGEVPAKDADGTTRPQGVGADLGAHEAPISGSGAPVISGSMDVWASTAAAFSYQIQANHAPTSYGAAPLPAGLTVSAGGLISGTATTPGTYSVVLTAGNSAGDGTATLTVHVTTRAHWPLGGAFAVPGRIEAEDFDQGAAEVAWHDSDGTHEGIAYRADTAVDVDTAGTGADTGRALGWTKAGEWLNYTINVATTGTYRFAVRAANGTTAGDVRLQVDGVDVGGAISLPGTTDWHIFQTSTSGDVALTAGVHVLTLRFDADGLNINYIDATLMSPSGNAAPSAMITAPADGTHYTAPATITLTADASDTDGTITQVELLSGVTVLGTDTTAAYGWTLTGIAAGTYTITARATDDDGDTGTSTAITIVVDAATTPTPPDTTETINNGSDKCGLGSGFAVLCAVLMGSGLASVRQRAV